MTLLQGRLICRQENGVGGVRLGWTTNQREMPPQSRTVEKYNYRASLYDQRSLRRERRWQESTTIRTEGNKRASDDLKGYGTRREEKGPRGTTLTWIGGRADVGLELQDDLCTHHATVDSSTEEERERDCKQLRHQSTTNGLDLVKAYCSFTCEMPQWISFRTWRFSRDAMWCINS